MQLQIQLTEQRRLGLEGLTTWQESALRPGSATRSGDLGTDEEADGDLLSDDGDEAALGEPGAEDWRLDEDPTGRTKPRRCLGLTDLIGSRPPRVLLRLSCADGTVSVQSCATPASPEAARALELLRKFVAWCFRPDRRSVTDPQEWAQLLGQTPAPLTRRLWLLVQLALEASEEVPVGSAGSEDDKAVVTPHDLGLERFANKFAALPDGTPFSIRLLLLDKRGREGGDHLFDQLPIAVKLLALRRALAREREEFRARSDNEFRDLLRDALEELLGKSVPKPTEKHVTRLREHFDRKGLTAVFPNGKKRKQVYEQLTTAAGPQGGS